MDQEGLEFKVSLTRNPGRSKTVLVYKLVDGKNVYGRIQSFGDEKTDVEAMSFVLKEAVDDTVKVE